MRSEFSFFYTNLGSRPDLAQRQYCRTDTTPTGVAFTRENLSALNQVLTKQ